MRLYSALRPITGAGILSSLLLFTPFATSQSPSSISLSIPTPLICEDTLAPSQAPFVASSVTCLLGCGHPIVVPSGSYLPGYVNETDIPYCQAKCVRADSSTGATDIAPAQLARAPQCSQECQWQRTAPGGTMENYAWCLYWCVEGGEFENLVKSKEAGGSGLTCVPYLGAGAPVLTLTQGNDVVTVSGFTNPPAWRSWYATQTIMARTTTVPTATTATDIWATASLPSGSHRASLFSTLPPNLSDSTRSTSQGAGTPAGDQGTGSSASASSSTSSSGSDGGMVLGGVWAGWAGFAGALLAAF